MARRLRLAAVGEIVEDVYLPEGRRFLGGISANFGRGAARAGAEATLFAAVGNDERGDRLRALLPPAGIEARIRTLPGPSAEQKIRIAADGERVFCGFDPSNALPLPAPSSVDRRMIRRWRQELWGMRKRTDPPRAPVTAAIWARYLETAR